MVQMTHNNRYRQSADCAPDCPDNREISGHRTDFGNGDEEALDVIRYVAPQPPLLERLALVRPQGLCRRTGSEENLLDRRQAGLPIRFIHQANDAHDTACPGAVVRPTLRRTGSIWRLRSAMSAFGGKAAGKASARPELENSQDPKRTRRLKRSRSHPLE